MFVAEGAFGAMQAGGAMLCRPAAGGIRGRRERSAAVGLSE